MSGKNHGTQAIKQKRGLIKTNMGKLGIKEKKRDTGLSFRDIERSENVRKELQLATTCSVIVGGNTTQTKSLRLPRFMQHGKKWRRFLSAALFLSLMSEFPHTYSGGITYNNHTNTYQNVNGSYFDVIPYELGIPYNQYGGIDSSWFSTSGFSFLAPPHTAKINI